jgi:hypothetical protein
MMPLVRGLVSQPLDLKHRGDDEGPDDEERHDVREGTFLNTGVHPDQWDRQQSRDAKRDRCQEVDRIGRLSLVILVRLCVWKSHVSIPLPEGRLPGAVGSTLR